MRVETASEREKAARKFFIGCVKNTNEDQMHAHKEQNRTTSLTRQNETFSELTNE